MLQVKPPRSRIPIYLASIGSRNVMLAGEIADGWLPAFYSPEHEAVMTAPLDEGLRKAGRDPTDVRIAVIAYTVRADDVNDARNRLRPLFASWIGPKGVGIRNSFFDLACRLGFDHAAHTVRGHYLEGRKAEAAAAVPDALLDEVALLGPLPAIVDRLAAWKASRVDTLILLTRDPDVIEAAQAAL
jgi:alkanesulfonate monooxygenase SsuD/methylene tetrahydromethanopterin reductase-like flavin-dependent oxidoreductase (luciferase family)